MHFSNSFISPALSALSSKSKVPVVLQSEAAECGLACISMVAQYYGDKQGITHLRQQIPVSLRGITLKDIMGIAHQLGFGSRALKVETQDLSKLTCPAILHWDMRHFVVLTKVKGNTLTIHDPSLGKRTLSFNDASKHLTGIALEITPKDNFAPPPAKPLLKLRDFFTRTIGFKRNLATLLALSALLQLFALATPYYMQTVVDDVLLQGNQALLIALAIGFSFLLMIETFTSVLRRLLILSVSSRLQLQMSASVFHHLLSLPLDFFAKRHVGDVVSRFGSLAHIREFLTTGLVTALLDGVMAIVTLVVMAIYSIKLTLFVVLIMAVYLLIRFALIPMTKRLTTEKIALAANEQSHFMESVRGMQPIRVYQQETQRHSQWQNKLVATLNKDISLGKLNIGSEAVNQTLFGIENIIVIFIAASLVMDNLLTVGMMLAFIAYKTKFTAALDSLVTKFIELRMLGVHFSRLSDIVLTKPAETTLITRQAQPYAPIPSSAHSLPISTALPAIQLEAENLGYRYGEGCSFIFENLNLSVKAGEIIAIVGASGSGKSTLLKCLMGLYAPSEGNVTHNAISAHRPPTIAAVLQEDICLSGSMAENISCFDDAPRQEEVMRAAQLACIHDEISAMPMQYHTLVGDMGSSLSGGQKQRLLLARALYRAPDILFLDEASSHLDIQNEHLINTHLKALNITRIMVAHRPQTIALADTVYHLVDGKLQLIPTSEVVEENDNTPQGDSQ
ncbi:peptidase domain-containing ABC transporter [Alteromonas sp. 1_MG-2023]|uniref:peptidase domain-containing ABC transporter n=1 Tax=Alteromonas sp. 1_MG-2023 TaxID=3062669 RepID=UPI0026E16FB0|nr:peptidase domain-containing ABC transporter [Alteromonas sp. 1_MG-2023]MDO6567972.1 peptidase domain-containing ABC transporter [Alteromonas sp. 1_MG-2023]